MNNIGKRRNNAIAFGAFFFFLLNLVANYPAFAHERDTFKSDPSAMTSEEKIGNHVFEVSKIVVNAAPQDVFSVLTDYGHTAGTFQNVKKCLLVKADGTSKFVSFEVLSSGFITFDYVVQITETYPSLIQWHRVSGAFKANEGYWKLEPLNNGTETLVTCSKFVDAGLMYPQPLVRAEIRASSRAVLGDLKSAAERKTAHVSGTANAS